MRDYVLYSGGAYGADTIFGCIAYQYGITKQYHIRPKGNPAITKSLKSLGIAPFLADQPTLAIAREKVFELIGLKLDSNLYSDLKARNYYQVNKSEMVLAVAYLESNTSVKGGTDVAVQLGIALGLPTYVLDVESEQWYIFNGISFVPCDTPVLTRKFTAVGTRDIENYNVKDSNGNWVPRQAFVGTEKANRIITKMREVFDKTFQTQLKVVTSNTLSLATARDTVHTHIYIYGDNTIKKGGAGQAVIRDCPNAFGIATKKLPSMTSGSFFDDSELEQNKIIIDRDIQNILDNYNGRIIVMPTAGLGKGLAKLDVKAPKTFEYLNKRLKEVFGFDNV